MLPSLLLLQVSAGFFGLAPHPGVSARASTKLALLVSPVPVPRAPPPRMAAPAVLGGDTAALLADNAAAIAALGAVAPSASEMQRLRFATAFESQEEAAAALKEAVAWREGEGRAIVAAAAAAVENSRRGGGWNNAPVAAAAPHAALAAKHITPSQIMTLSTGEGDLVLYAEIDRDRAHQVALSRSRFHNISARFTKDGGHQRWGGKHAALRTPPPSQRGQGSNIPQG